MSDKWRMRKMVQAEEKAFNHPTHLEFQNVEERKTFFACASHFNSYIDLAKFRKARSEVTSEKITQYHTILQPPSCLCPDFAKGTSKKSIICKHLLYLFLQTRNEMKLTPPEGIPQVKEEKDADLERLFNKLNQEVNK